MEDGGKPRRVRRVWALLVVFGALALIVGGLVEAFRFGAGAAIVSAAGMLLFFKEPARAFDWRGALDDIADFLGAACDWLKAPFGR
jgi:hypothetical protein